MFVIQNGDHLDAISKKYTILELDTLLIKDGMEVTNYGVIGPAELNISLLTDFQRMVGLHDAFMQNYKQQHWEFCKTAIETLTGSINPFMDTFYETMQRRIDKFEKESTVDSTFPCVDVR